MSVHQFVADFLKKEGYSETLKTFEKEYGKPISTELPHNESLQDIIADRVKYLSIEKDTSSPYEISLDDDLKKIKELQFKEWSAPYPRISQEFPEINELVVACDIMNNGGERLAILATAKMALIVIDLETRKILANVPRVIGNVVVRRIRVVGASVLLCGMNGKVYLGKFDKSAKTFNIQHEQQIHTKLVSDMTVVHWREKNYLVSVGWDNLVKVHEVRETAIEESFQAYSTPNRALCMDACVYQDQLVILVGKSEMTLMDVLTIKEDKVDLAFKIALNDAEFSAAGFSPHAIQIFHNGQVPLVAVGTSHEPYMRLVLVSLKEFGKDGDSIRRNQIITNINTMAPQDKYSQALLSWRPDGSGVWVFGEDGVVRGVDLLKERVAVELKKSESRIKSFAKEGDLLLVCDTDNVVVQWSPEA